MTLTQLQYIVAVDRLRSFQAAAKECFVTQPTLSQQVQKLEELLGVMIFDRSRQPVAPTPVGERILAQAREVLRDAEKIKSLIREDQETVMGDLRVGIIPTLAPFLLPRFIGHFRKTYPGVHLSIEEMRTADIVQALSEDRMDVGLLVTPLEQQGLEEIPLFYEPFLIYASPGHTLLKNKKVQEKDLSLADVFLLAEGHCFRSQVLNLCRTRSGKGKVGGGRAIEFESGSLQTLKRMVDEIPGYTFLPSLAAEDLLTAREREQLREFGDPAPVREVSLVVHKSFIKRKMVEALKAEIIRAVPKDQLEKPKRKQVVEI